MLRLVLPKGSLERATMQLFEDADLAVIRASDVAYRASIDDPRIDEVRILRPQEIPVYVADGLFDLGITGRDCVEERGSEVVSLGKLAYSKATGNPARIVLAVGADSPANTLAELAKSVADRPGSLRVSTEYPGLTRRALEARGKVLVKLNVSAENLDAVLAVLPSMRAPTVSELSGGGAFALETVVPKADINVLIPALRDQGATDILELALSKIVH